MISFKQKLLQHCVDLLLQRAGEYKDGIEDARMAQQSETKSSAGDKYETAREMMTQQIETLSVQLTAVERDITLLKNLLSNPVAIAVITRGSVVTTTAGIFLIATGLGRVPFEGQTIQVISPDAPLAKLLLGKSKGQTIQLNGKEIGVEGVE